MITTPSWHHNIYEKAVMIIMFIKIFIIFGYLWFFIILIMLVGKRGGLCVVGSPPKRDRRGQRNGPGWDEQRERCWGELRILISAPTNTIGNKRAGVVTMMDPYCGLAIHVKDDQNSKLDQKWSVMEKISVLEKTGYPDPAYINLHYDHHHHHDYHTVVSQCHHEQSGTM